MLYGVIETWRARVVGILSLELYLSPLPEASFPTAKRKTRIHILNPFSSLSIEKTAGDTSIAYRFWPRLRPLSL